MKVVFPVQHGFAVYSKREMLIVGSEEEWLWIGIRCIFAAKKDLPVNVVVKIRFRC